MSKLKVTNKKVVSVQNWDSLVIDTYGRPYSFQQQDGCKARGTFAINIPDDEAEDYHNDTVLEIASSEEMGVSFKAWLDRDPTQQLTENDYSWAVKMWWERNFYPDIYTIANDLHKKGLIDAGEYLIHIDW